MVLLKGLHFINWTLKPVLYLYPAFFILAPQLFPIFSYKTCLTVRARKVRVTFSLESLIRLTHGSSFRNSLGVWKVRAGHSRLRAFSQVVKDLRGITVSLVPVPKTSLFVPEIGTVFLPSTKTPYSAKFPSSSSSVKLTSIKLYTLQLLLDDRLLKTILTENAVFHVSWQKKIKNQIQVPTVSLLSSPPPAKELAVSMLERQFSPWTTVLRDSSGHMGGFYSSKLFFF